MKPFQVKIRCDVDGKKLIIEDTGVGMSKEEMINNLGRIAQSGTCPDSPGSLALPARAQGACHLASAPCLEPRGVV